MSDQELQVVDVIRRVYLDDPEYYLRILQNRLPLTFDEPQVTWLSLPKNYIIAAKRNPEKWKLLGAELVSAGFIEILNLKTIRKFD